MHGAFFLNLRLKAELYMKISAIFVKLFLIAIDKTIVKKSNNLWLPSMTTTFMLQQ